MDSRSLREEEHQHRVATPVPLGIADPVDPVEEVNADQGNPRRDQERADLGGAEEGIKIVSSQGTRPWKTPVLG